MEQDVFDCIRGAKRLIDVQIANQRITNGILFETYHKTYCWTNEKVSGYLNFENFEGKTKALSVLASGDQAFNLIYYGIKDIDTFDINKLTEYFSLGLKRAMILKYDYYEFLKVMRTLCCNDFVSIEYISDIILSLFPYMEEKHRVYWQSLIDHNNKKQKSKRVVLNLLQMLTSLYLMKDERIGNNTYLQSEENYNRLRQNLGKANINFRRVNAANLGSEFNDKYDFILLSNILDYIYMYWGKNWTYTSLQDYEQRLVSLTKSGGTIFLHYLFDRLVPEGCPLIYESHVTINDLTDEKIINFKDKDYDGMILKRVK